MEILHINPEGVSPFAVTDPMPASGMLWIDCVRGGDQEWPQLLRDLTGTVIHERHLHDSLNTTHASFYDYTHDYDMLVFRGIAAGGLEPALQTRPVAFFITERVLVTVQSGESRSIAMVRERLARRPSRQLTEPRALLHFIMNTMVDRVLSLREALLEQMDRHTAELLGGEKREDEWHALLNYRRQLRLLEILCEEQEGAILAWRDDNGEELSDTLRVRFTDLLEHVRRMSKFTQQQQHELDSLLQLHFSMVSHRTNAIVRTLTLLSAIFMPLSLIAGIYGMNFEHMPELHSHYGYFITIGGMAVLALMLLALFRLKRWW